MCECVRRYSYNQTYKIMQMTLPFSDHPPEKYKRSPITNHPHFLCTGFPTPVLPELHSPNPPAIDSSHFPFSPCLSPLSLSLSSHSLTMCHPFTLTKKTCSLCHRCVYEIIIVCCCYHSSLLLYPFIFPFYSLFFYLSLFSFIRLYSQDLYITVFI
jgi:hypothetical protein